jgi:hypothetical protein
VLSCSFQTLLSTSGVPHLAQRMLPLPIERQRMLAD